MKKSLQEELRRIHEITYGKQNLSEGLMDDIMSTLEKGYDYVKDEVKKIDEPTKADYVTGDVEQFYKTLDDAIAQGGLKQQARGSMTYQKGVETMQIGLLLLGYQLPKHGVDGLFGPETGSAVRKFKADNQILKEAAEEIRSTLNDLGYTEKNGQLDSGGEITDNLSSIVSDILREFKRTNPTAKVTVTGGNDKFHQGFDNNSKHKIGNAVDLVINPYNADTSRDFLKILNDYKAKNSNFTYMDEYKNKSENWTGSHFHLQYGVGKAGTQAGGVDATPETLKKLSDLLKQKNVSSEDLKQYIDKVKTGGGAQFTDLDLNTDEGYKNYAKICQRFIDSNPPNLLGITGDMMAKSAKGAFIRHNKYVPPELALAQLKAEGGISNPNPQSRPIRTKNPYNFRNTDKGGDYNMTSVEAGIDAYYNLIAKNYLGKGKTANDLVKDFTNHNGNRYASAGNYEQVLNNIAGKANMISKTVVNDKDVA